MKQIMVIIGKQAVLCAIITALSKTAAFMVA